jgi:predicted acylesterase/phospholipase RssA
MTAAVAVLLLGQVQAIDKCHALVLSGGGNKGSYEAGTIYGMAHILDASEVTWDVVSGVSAGAMNSGGISIFEVGNEKAMSEWLTELWVSLDNSNIYQMWPGGYA